MVGMENVLSAGDLFDDRPGGDKTADRQLASHANGSNRFVVRVDDADQAAPTTRKLWLLFLLLLSFVSDDNPSIQPLLTVAVVPEPNAALCFALEVFTLAVIVFGTIPDAAGRAGV